MHTIIGGTGFLGYHTIQLLLEHGEKCKTIALPEEKVGDLLPKSVDIQYGNIFSMNEASLRDLFSNSDTLVYAIGPDDRVVPPAPAYAFYHEYLVEKCGKILQIARSAGITRAVVLNSYFSYFDAQWPFLELTKHHPYIRARVEQAERVIQAGQGDMDVMVLQLPYIFGTMPHRIPLYRDSLFNYLLGMNPIFFPRGGSNMVAVEHVAESIYGALKYGEHGQKYLVGDENLSWNTLILKILAHLGMKRKIINIPPGLARLKGKQMQAKYLQEQKEPGLSYLHLFHDIEARFFYFNPEPYRKQLKYGQGGLDLAIQRTLDACYPSKNIETNEKKNKNRTKK